MNPDVVILNSLHYIQFPINLDVSKYIIYNKNVQPCEQLIDEPNNENENDEAIKKK